MDAKTRFLLLLSPIVECQTSDNRLKGGPSGTSGTEKILSTRTWAIHLQLALSHMGHRIVSKRDRSSNIYHDPIR
ncbi:hypothetical protein CDAR_300291 [Caerostris darwini]|uniref:Secreted protein n=1 Tax=Caerostris darwini TaxID=1538125 RepID=A0AAV4NTA9_9ARAC|nr:hypothetical protein CDAR_300291 [Caerostris darwini]